MYLILPSPVSTYYHSQLVNYSSCQGLSIIGYRYQSYLGLGKGLLCFKLMSSHFLQVKTLIQQNLKAVEVMTYGHAWDANPGLLGYRTTYDLPNYPHHLLKGTCCNSPSCYIECMEWEWGQTLSKNYWKHIHGRNNCTGWHHNVHHHSPQQMPVSCSLINTF